MFASLADRAFRRFQERGDSKALAQVFDATAVELEGLARYLASPEAPAEDLLQATYLTAIESRHRFDASQRVLPWLVGILANHAREARRRSRRAIDPERLRAETGLDPSDAAAASELSQTLDQAIARLPEAQRAVLRLYLQHGLEPAEIARSLERPQGTVRAQLSRGLKQLRRLLTESVAASRAYALVPAARLAEIRASVLLKAGGPAIPLASGALTLGFLAMSLNKKLLLAAGLLLAAFLAYTLRDRISADPGTTHESAVLPVTVDSVPDANTAPAQAPVEPRTQVPAIQEPLTPRLAVVPTTGSLLVRVSDEDGEPLPDIGIGLRPMTQLQSLGTLLDFVRTDSDGNVIFEELPPERVVIEIDRAAARGIVEIVAGERAKHEFRLRGVRVEGRVVDERGLPVAGASVLANAERLEAIAIARTDSSGAFGVDCISPRVALQARKEGFAPSKAHPVLGKEGETWQVQLALEGEATEVTGRVLDPGGAPVARALVAFVPDAAKNLTPYDRNGPQVRSVQVYSGADGSFRIREVPRGPIIVTAAGRVGEWTPASLRIEVGASPEHVELRLGIGATLEGTITDRGKPVSDCSIFLFCSQPEMPVSYLFNLLATRNATSDGEGRFRIVGILPGQVEMRALRNGFEMLGQQTIPMAAGETKRWDLECLAAKGRSIDITVEPAAAPAGSGRWLVHVHSGDDSNPSVQVNGTNARGRVHFDGLVDGRCTATVYIQPEGGDLIPILSHEFDAREKKLTLRIPAERLRFQPLRGRVIDASGAALKDRTVQVLAAQEGPAILLQRSTDARGVFDFAAMPPGRYTISLLDGDVVAVLREFTIVGDRAEDLGNLTSP